MLGRRIIDKTGIQGTFDVTQNGPRIPRLATTRRMNPCRIQTALRETLGLDLKPGRGEAEVLAINDIERRYEN